MSSVMEIVLCLFEKTWYSVVLKWNIVYVYTHTHTHIYIYVKFIRPNVSIKCKVSILIFYLDGVLKFAAVIVLLSISPFMSISFCFMWFSSVQSLSCVWLFVTPRTAEGQASLSITNSRSLLKLISIESVMSSNHLILRRPLLLLPSIFPSIKVFSNESALCVRWPKYWSFSFSSSPSSEHSGLICFRMDWLDLLAVQVTLKSLLQHHSSKASILWHSAFFIVQLSHPYTTTGKTIALARWTFVGKVMSLLFNMLSRFVITFLPRSKCLLISLLQSPSAVIFEPRKTKSATMSIVSPSICQEVMGPANRALPRECTGHSKHPLPTTQEKTLHMDIARWSAPKSDWLYSLQPKMEKLYTVSKNKTGSWLWLRSWTPYCQIQT